MKAIVVKGKGILFLFNIRFHLCYKTRHLRYKLLYGKYEKL